MITVFFSLSKELFLQVFDNMAFIRTNAFWRTCWVPISPGFTLQLKVFLSIVLKNIAIRTLVINYSSIVSFRVIIFAIWWEGRAPVVCALNCVVSKPRRTRTDRS